MPSRDEIETRIESLATEVAELRLRVRALETGEPRSALAATETVTPTTGSPPEPEEWAAAEIVALAGRSLVVLGGAFLLRAVSSTALIPALGGPLLGLAYAAWWLVRADRSGANRRSASAFFHGLSGLAIAYPLIWETTSRFHLLSGFVAAPAIAVFLALGLAVAARRSLRNLSWVAIFAALATSIALLLGSHEFVLYCATVLVIAGGVEACGLGDRWPELRWGPAAVLDLILILLALLASQPRPSPGLAASLPSGGVIAVSLLTPTLYLVSVATSTLAHRRCITLFELLQVSAALLCGVGTALVAISFAGGDPTLIAAALVAVGAACYAAAFGSLRTDSAAGRNFHAYSTFAGLLVLVGTFLFLDTKVLAPAWLALAAGAVAAGLHPERRSLHLHGAIYLGAAAFASGLVDTSLRGLVGLPAEAGLAMAPEPATVALAAAAIYVTLASKRESAAPWSEALPRALVAVIVIWSLAGLSSLWIAGLLLHVWSGANHAALLASVRTGVLSAIAAAIAWAGPRWALPELRWLLFPLMAATAARMVGEDLRYGEPLNLFLALGFYGGALIATSRLLRSAT